MKTQELFHTLCTLSVQNLFYIISSRDVSDETHSERGEGNLGNTLLPTNISHCRDQWGIEPGNSGSWTT